MPPISTLKLEKLSRFIFARVLITILFDRKKKKRKSPIASNDERESILKFLPDSRLNADKSPRWKMEERPRIETDWSGLTCRTGCCASTIDNNHFRVTLTKYYCPWRVNGIIDSRVRLPRCCGIMGTMMELCGLTQSTFEARKKFTSLHARARINVGYMIAGVSMVATIFPHGNSIMYYGYVKFDENLA